MANNVYGAIALKTTSGALDQIDGVNLLAGDISIVVTNANTYFYKLFTNDTSEENTPYIIRPVLNGSNKRWRLTSISETSGDLNVVGKLITNMLSYTGNTLTVVAGSETLATFNKETSSVSFKRISSVDSTTMVSNLNANYVGGRDGTKMMLSDGTISFEAPVGGSTPINDNHLATKSYIDNLVQTFDGDIKSDGSRQFTAPISGQTPVSSSHLTTKLYVDTISNGLNSAINNLSISGVPVATIPKSVISKQVNNIACPSSLYINAIDYADYNNGAPSEFTYTRASKATAFNQLGYLKTYNDNELRHEWDPVTGEYRGWKIEGSNTNYLKSSEDFRTVAEGNSVSAWNANNCSISSDAIIAPDGTLTADKLVEDITTDSKGRSQLITANDNAIMTFSIFIKAAENTKIRLYILHGTNYSLVSYDLVNVTATLFSTSGTATYYNSTIENVGNGWYRCSITASLGSGITLYSCGITFLNSSGVGAYLGNGVNGFYVWGAQCEWSHFNTSYIKTTTAGATRAADFLTLNASNFPFNNVEGTMFAEATSAVSGGISARVILSLENTSANVMYMYIADNVANDPLYCANATGSVTQTNTNTLSSSTPYTFFKIAMGYKYNNTGMSSNGNIAVDTICEIPTITTLRIGHYVAGGLSNFLSGYIRKVMYFPRRLSDAELQTLTT